jgi:hypothetical protein
VKPRKTSILTTIAIAMVAGLAWFAAGAGPAAAAGCNCTPPPPPPPTDCGCGPGGHGHGHGDVNINLYLKATAMAQASAQASANASSNAAGVAFVGGGGGSGGGAMPPTPEIVQGLNVEDVSRTRAAYTATRTVVRRVAIQAMCMDDKGVPHPASQVSPDANIADGYDGEIYRCIAGTHMQATIGDYSGKADFGHGQTMACAKGDALYHLPPTAGQGGGQVVCRAQKPARDCNERSLLRRFGAGMKILTLVRVETYTAYREETHTSTSSGSVLTLDGGVGGVMN